MFCPNCNAKLEMHNQQFCQDCGQKLTDASPDSELVKTYSASQETQIIHRTQQRPLKQTGPRPLSKASLAFGIVSVIILATTFNLGTSIFIEPYFLPAPVRHTLMFVFGILNALGFVFGVVSKIFNIKARKSEIQSKAIKAGNILGLLGLILNLLLMIISFSLVGIIVM
ncbi:MAG: zinc ribbon domain-containing protein [Candidatus Lokiarchaeota archaeon]|nr:zinc ribbon domain-containing protein [Candidatus Lokiarchaeota archaeon]